MPFSFHGKVSLLIYMERQQHHHISGVETSLQNAGGSLWSSIPPQNLLWSMPSGCLALDKWFCSGSIQKDRVRSGIRTHTLYVAARAHRETYLQFALTCTLVWIQKNTRRMIFGSLCAGCWRADQTSAGSLHSWNWPHLNSSWGKD